jgi:2-hydroxychromene-2-carboxylate isomerase
LKSIVNKLDGSEEEYFDFIKSPEAKERLISNTQELIDRGGFGSPTFFLNDDDMYFGNDRIQLLKEKL